LTFIKQFVNLLIDNKSSIFSKLFNTIEKIYLKNLHPSAGCGVSWKGAG